MLQTLIRAFSTKELRQRIFFIFFSFAIFALTIHITVPGINIKAWERLLGSAEFFKFLGLFTGGALNKFSICAMGITPYINASIIMQLLTVVIPKLQELQKEGGEAGRRKISQYIRSLTVALAILQATIMTINLARIQGEPVFLSKGLFYYLTVIFSLTAGTAFLMWLGEQMTGKGIGNGVSMLIFAGIVIRYPVYVAQTFEIGLKKGPQFFMNLIVFFAMAVLLIMTIIVMTQGQRKVPVQYAKRVVGRRVYGGTSTYIPIRVNNAGVISIIFAISIMYLPATFIQFLHPAKGSFMSHVVNFINNVFDPGGVFYNVLYAVLVILFTYFYSAITFNIMDVSDNMKKYGGFIPGIRPGRPTAEYLERILSRITFVSAIALAVIAVAPTYVMALSGVKTFYLGSTSLLIIVGVVLDTMQQIEARMVMKYYQGFMK